MPEREESERGRENMAFSSDSGRKFYLKQKCSLKNGYVIVYIGWGEVRCVVK